MFARISAFEFRYQLRQPIFWIALLLFVLLAFGSVASSNIQLGSSDNIHKNAPFVIGQSCLVFAVIYTFVVVAFVANVIVRDDDTGFGAIVRSTPIGKFEYLSGRLTGTLGGQGDARAGGVGRLCLRLCGAGAAGSVPDLGAVLHPDHSHALDD